MAKSTTKARTQTAGSAFGAQIAVGTGPANGSVGNGAVDTKHPQWDDHIDEWVLMRRTARGTKAIKDAGYEYLPIPLGFKAQADKGLQMYNDYKMRAQFPEIVSPTLMGMVGVIHRMEAKIEMPTAMEPLWESATDDGLPLEALHRRITFEVITTGRYGLLAEAARAEAGGSPLPYIVGYSTEDMINWSKDRDLVVLDECELVRTGFSWQPRNQWRVLGLDDAGNYIQTLYSSLKQTQDTIEVINPTAFGNKPINEIPFVFIGPKNLLTDIDDAPIIGVARAAIAIYQLSADYRHQLYMSGQETLFCFGMDAPEAVGAGVIVHTDPKSKDQQPADAKYVGPSGAGIDKHKLAIEDERVSAAAAGARLFDNNANAQESGDARRIRYAAETATLVSIALTSASGLERALRFIALMMGLDPNKVIVTPNLSFIDSKLTPQEITALVAAWQADAFSYETLYDNLQRGEVASPERDAEEEQEQITQDHADDINDPATAGLIDPKTGLPIPPAPITDPVTGLPIVPPTVPPKKPVAVKKPVPA